jgi:MFS family permease
MLMPLTGVSVFGLSVGDMGLVLTGMALMSLMLLPVAATISDRHDRTLAIVPSLAGVAFSLLVIGFAGDVVWFLAGAGLLAVSGALSGPAPAAIAADPAPDENRGLTTGIFRTAGDLGLLVGPPLLGLIADLGGYPLAFGVNAGLVGLAATIFLVATRKRAPV